MLYENLPVRRSGAVPVGGCGQTFSQTQLRCGIIRPDPQGGPERLDGVCKCTLRLLCRAEQIEPVEIPRFKKERALVDPCRGVVLLISVNDHGQATYGFGVARVRPCRLLG